MQLLVASVMRQGHTVVVIMIGGIIFPQDRSYIIQEMFRGDWLNQVMSGEFFSLPLDFGSRLVSQDDDR